MADSWFNLMRHRPSLTAAVALALALCAACGARTPTDASGAGTGSGGKETKIERVVIKGETFDLELSADDARREKGLGERTSIPDAGGMIFVFPDAQVRRFWMLDCVIDMDILFLDPLGIVTAVHHMKADPQRPGESRDAYLGRLKLYPSVAPAQFAIELKAGTADRLGIKTGQKIELDRRRLKSLAR